MKAGPRVMQKKWNQCGVAGCLGIWSAFGQYAAIEYISIVTGGDLACGVEYLDSLTLWDETQLTSVPVLFWMNQSNHRHLNLTGIAIHWSANMIKKSKKMRVS